MDLFVKEVKVRDLSDSGDYFAQIPSIANLKSLKFNQPLTFFVGENGSGKSTLLEAIAVNFGFNAEGGSLHYNFTTENTHSDLYQYLTLVKGVKRPKDGFFLRAESFYNVASYEEQIAGNKSMRLHYQSHGESFLSLVNQRLSGQGVYILDFKLIWRH
jgi:predicted ATPase